MTSDVIEFGRTTMILRVNSNGVIASASEAIQRSMQAALDCFAAALLAMERCHHRPAFHGAG